MDTPTEVDAPLIRLERDAGDLARMSGYAAAEMLAIRHRRIHERARRASG